MKGSMLGYVLNSSMFLFVYIIRIALFEGDLTSSHQPIVDV